MYIPAYTYICIYSKVTIVYTCKFVAFAVLGETK